MYKVWEKNVNRNECKRIGNNDFVMSAAKMCDISKWKNESKLNVVQNHEIYSRK